MHNALPPLLRTSVPIKVFQTEQVNRIHSDHATHAFVACGCELDFVSRAILMNIDNGANLARTKALVRNVAKQSDHVVFTDRLRHLSLHERRHEPGNILAVFDNPDAEDCIGLTRTGHVKSNGILLAVNAGLARNRLLFARRRAKRIAKQMWVAAVDAEEPSEEDGMAGVSWVIGVENITQELVVGDYG